MEVTGEREFFARADRLLNETSSASSDATQSVVLQNPHLATLPIGNTVVRRDYADLDEVRIIAGGPAGHEPLYTGFVGKGMLTAAIHGEIFVAPPSYHITNVIRELSAQQELGVLVIIQNNPGDTLNFGIALEKCTGERIKVKMLTVTDDCSDVLPSNKTDQPRGLTGVVLLLKIAGALADQQLKSMIDIHSYCEDVLNRISTVLLTLKPCTAKNEMTCVCRKRRDSNQAVIGGGLHGEIGSKVIPVTTTEAITEELLKEMTKHVVFDETSPFVILVNNLCMSKLEESVFTGELIKMLVKLNVKIVRFYVATFMTSLDMKGFTITVLKADEEIVTLLDHPTNAPSWNSTVTLINAALPLVLTPRINLFRYPRIVPRGPLISMRQANVLLLQVQFACDALVSCERQLNLIDSEGGDGDTGTRIKVAASYILEGLQDKKINLECMYVFFKTLSRIVETIGGTLAALYAIIFESAANYMGELDVEELVDGVVWLGCLFHVVNTLKSHTKTEEGGTNMLAPLSACAQATSAAMAAGEVGVMASFESGVSAAENAVQRTRQAGKKYPDPGAHAVGIWMRAVLEGLKFRHSSF